MSLGMHVSLLLCPVAKNIKAEQKAKAEANLQNSAKSLGCLGRL
jgi:hypothetical protein